MYLDAINLMEEFEIKETLLPNFDNMKFYKLYRGEINTK
jgi:hypothetical protein